ncbi:hypothetical protein BDZ85DRAFT_130176 [Elsinoe ampelina]|uniref:Uncharacterized protein n=1 Tax=Elsinoe ampelina TaxID=302913 RepID=A0A6A6GA65_9PEZI|nr:hypothetical protein BDZ85DRAFT_130176 [Elsinoe ampelina]
MSIALVTTGLAPGLGFSTWLAYYLQYVTLIIIYADSLSSQRQFADLIGQDLPVYVFLGSTKSPEMSPESRIMLRQDENLADAIDLLLHGPLNYDISWLLHLDTDELLYFPSHPSTWDFDALSQGAPALHFSNYEAIPLSHPVTDPFRECTNFLLNSRENKFMAYGNGKSAVRLKPGIKPNGPHGFRGWGMRESERKVPAEQAVVLHYPTPDFESWKAKFQRYGKFPDYWYGDEKMPNRMEFMLRSRDVVARAEETGEWEEARGWFGEWTFRDERLREGREKRLVGVFEPLRERVGSLTETLDEAEIVTAKDEL